MFSDIDPGTKPAAQINNPVAENLYSIEKKKYKTKRIRKGGRLEIKKEVLKRNEKENRTEQKAKRGQQHDQ